MNRYCNILTVGVVIACVMFACAILPHDQASKNATPSIILTPTAKCPLLPLKFKTSDLTGVWIASYMGGDDTDMLIIRSDGTYKQIYDAPLSNLHYESGWQEWWIEYRESGYLRLHMKGMRRCDQLLSTCTRQNGGLDPTEYIAIDYCENLVVEMPTEVILIVTGVPDSEISTSPLGITLRQTRVAGSEWTWSFRLQNDVERP